MIERNVILTFEKAKEWFNSGNVMLKDIALQAFGKEELVCSFKDITTFKKACEALGLNYDIISIVTKDVATFSRASAAMFKLNIIRKALNLGQDLHLTQAPEHSRIYYPCISFVTESSAYFKGELNAGRMKVIGKIKSEGEEYNVLAGRAFSGAGAGLGGFSSGDGVGSTYTNIGFLGCANEEIAQHFGKYFGMLITEAKYADMVNFEIL